MANATIVQLGSSFDSTATTFEQEFSEARGRGRARRQARRMDRIKKRDERRSARQSARQNRRAERQTRRADMRQTRKQRREDNKMRRVEARQERKMRRSEGRQARKDLKSQRELDRDAAAMEQQDMMDERYGAEPAMDEPIMQDQAYDEGGYDEGGYAEEGGYEEEGGYDEGGYDEEGGYEEEGGYDEEGGYEEEGGYDEEGYEFDGDNYEFFDDAEGETPFDYADGSGVQVAPMVQDVANRIEWNKELCCRLKDKAASGSIPQSVAKNEIAKSVQRIDELKSCLDAWCNFEGEFMSDANGNVQFKKVDGATRAKLANKYKRKERIMALRAALAKAKNDRKRVGSGRRIVNRTTPPVQGKPSRPMQSVTNVEMGLSPKIGNQKIVIPARLSNADGNPTGIIGIDDAGDIDSRYIDVKLGADGDKSKTSKLPMKPILIAVGIGALIGIAYFAFKKK